MESVAGMNEELQAAYNEWLLRYGYKAVPVITINKDCMYPLVILMHDFEPHDLLKRESFRHTTYQLKTPEELQNETANT